MNPQLPILIAALAFGLFSLAFSFVCFRRQRHQRTLLEFAEKQIEDLENSQIRNREMFDVSAQRTNEQSRRIAWLEARVRQPKTADDEMIDETAAGEPAKLSMTERRHRVIALASRGQNAEAIATTLGIMPGEVELIIRLNQAAVGK
jgi:uncharacterized protein DUF6115